MVLDAPKNNSFGFLPPALAGQTEQRKAAMFPYPNTATLEGSVINHNGNPASIEITPTSGQVLTVTQEEGVQVGAVLIVKNLHATYNCTVGGAAVAAAKTSVLIFTPVGYVLLGTN